MPSVTQKRSRCNACSLLYSRFPLTARCNIVRSSLGNNATNDRGRLTTGANSKHYFPVDPPPCCRTAGFKAPASSGTAAPITGSRTFNRERSFSHRSSRDSPRGHDGCFSGANRPRAGRNAATGRTYGMNMRPILGSSHCLLCKGSQPRGHERLGAFSPEDLVMRSASTLPRQLRSLSPRDQQRHHGP
jgi:hypothetical protein